jgi:Restriction endonuclease BglII
MQTAQTHSHRRAQEELADKSLLQEVLGLAVAPLIGVAPGMAPAVKEHFESKWSELGWAIEVAVDPQRNLTINAMKQRVGMTVQTGNVARAFYDLLKFQAMYLNGRVDVAVLMLPSTAAASTLGSNIANYGRVTDEMELYFHLITVPVFIVSFE